MGEYLTERVETLAAVQLNGMLEGMWKACPQGITLARDLIAQEFLESSFESSHL